MSTPATACPVPAPTETAFASGPSEKFDEEFTACLLAAGLDFASSSQRKRQRSPAFALHQDWQAFLAPRHRKAGSSARIVASRAPDRAPLPHLIARTSPAPQ